MGHWKRLIKISGGTDGYYCINNMTLTWPTCYYITLLLFLLFYLLSCSLWSCLLVTVHAQVIVSAIMLPVDFATLPDASYTW